MTETTEAPAYLQDLRDVAALLFEIAAQVPSDAAGYRSRIEGHGHDINGAAGLLAIIERHRSGLSLDATLVVYLESAAGSYAGTRTMADLFGVSQGKVQDAVRRLQDAGTIKRTRGSGPSFGYFIPTQETTA